MCGIIALILANPSSETACAHQLHEALYTLQHRGQDACGIATCASGGKIFQCKGNGRAEAVFKNGGRLGLLPGSMGVAHLRYPTSGTTGNGTNSEAQPLYVNSPYGIVLTHNGNLTNSIELKRYLDQEAYRHVNTDSDSELILNIFADELNSFRKARANNDDLIAALRATYKRVEGAWACVAMLAGYGILGFRDPWGIRPLILGKRGDDYMLASESPALRQRGFEIMRDIAPAECVIIEKGRAPRFYQVEERKAFKLDCFELIYLARPDSVIDGISVLRARHEMGLSLAKTIRAQLTPEELASIDAVIPVPETSVPSAKSVAEELRKPYIEGFIKNRYVFRTFIELGQSNREHSVRRKLACIDLEFRDRTVLLVDDSIVRGTTSREITALAKSSGAKKIYFASCSPRITHPHIHGIDLASPSELIAHHRDNEAIARYLGVQKVIFQSLDDLKAACARASTVDNGPTDFEVGVFCGKYCTPVGDAYFEHLEQLRGEKKKRKSVQAAREALANGFTNSSVNGRNHQIAVKSQDVIVGQEVPVPSNNQQQMTKQQQQNLEAMLGAESVVTPEDRMDISLHNFGDHE